MPIIKMNEDNRSSEMGLFPSSSGQITVGSEMGFVAKFIMTNTAGGILVVGKDDRNYWLPSVPENELFPFLYKKVLATGTDWQGYSRVTVTANLTFFGAE